MTPDIDFDAITAIIAEIAAEEVKAKLDGVEFDNVAIY